MRRIVLAVATLLFVGTTAPARATMPIVPQADPVPVLTASAWLVADADSGMVLASWMLSEERPMASVTKIMTALVVRRHAELDELVVISERAAAVGEAEIDLVPGEVWSVRELLEAIMVRSANDAAMALAEHVGGSVEGFADLMNREARELGLLHSHFVNPHGLDNPDHYTSARDLLFMARELLDDPVLSRMARTKVVKFRPAPDGTLRRAVNTNRLLGAYPGVVGMKTGYTSQAGRVLVSVLEERDRRFIAVVMGSDDHFADSRALLEWAAGTGGLHDHILRALLPEEGGAGDGIVVSAREAERLRSLADLPDGRDRLSPLAATPLGEDLVTRFRAMLPALLGGGV